MGEAPAPVTTLYWGVKQSFRSYVEAVGGAAECLEGAQRADDGGFAFAAAPESGLSLDAGGRPQGTGRFLGEVRFAAHGGMLNVRLADLALEAGPDGAVLTVTDEGGGRAEIARLDLAAIAREEDGGVAIPAALTLEGVRLLGDHYPPGAPLDPVRLASSGA